MRIIFGQVHRVRACSKCKPENLFSVHSVSDRSSNSILLSCHSAVGVHVKVLCPRT